MVRIIFNFNLFIIVHDSQEKREIYSRKNIITILYFMVQLLKLCNIIK